MKLLSRRQMATAAAACAMVMAMPALVQAKGGDEVRMRASLTGPRLNAMTPSGSADFRTKGNRSQLSIEVEDVKVAPGTSLDVLLDGNKIGSITVGAPTLGGEIEFHTTDGDVVPAVQKGSVVLVKLGDQAILAGVF